MNNDGSNNLLINEKITDQQSAMKLAKGLRKSFSAGKGTPKINNKLMNSKTYLNNDKIM
jgi:hypothetical protein